MRLTGETLIYGLGIGVFIRPIIREAYRGIGRYAMRAYRVIARKPLPRAALPVASAPKVIIHHHAPRAKALNLRRARKREQS